MKPLIIATALLVTLVLLASITLVCCGLNDRTGIADVALVLGNAVHPDGTPSHRLKARLDTTMTFFKRGDFPLIIVSGGTGQEGVPEGSAMKAYLVRMGIPEAAVIVDDEGVNTRASAIHTKQILNARNLRSVFVITQYFHVPRSKLALHQLGITPVYNAHARFFEARDIYSIARELPAYIKYALTAPAREN